MDTGEALFMICIDIILYGMNRHFHCSLYAAISDQLSLRLGVKVSIASVPGFLQADVSLGLRLK